MRRNNRQTGGAGTAPRAAFTPVVSTLLALQTIILIVTLVIVALVDNAKAEELINKGSLSFEGLFVHGEVWRLFTHLVLLNLGSTSVTLLYWAISAIILLYLGSQIEELWGGKRFAVAYLCIGVSSGLASILLAKLGPPPVGTTYIYGPAGALLGVILLYGLIFSEEEFCWGISTKYFIWFLIMLAGAGLFGLDQLHKDTFLFLPQSSGLAIALLYFVVEPRWFDWRDRRMSRRQLRELDREYKIRAKVDVILEKISRIGMTSLTREERQFLRQASRLYRKNRDPLGRP